jgi:TPR repeat protein
MIKSWLLRVFILMFLGEIIFPCFLLAELPEPSDPGEADAATVREMNQRVTDKYKQFDAMSLDSLQKVGEAGDEVAQFILANRCYVEIKTPDNVERSLYWLRKSAENGFSPAQSYLASVYLNGQYGQEKNYEEAFKWASKAVAQRFVDAMALVGIMYIKGNGVKQDSQKGLKWLLRGADRGSLMALENLVAVYLNGEGAEKDPSKAFEYAKEAAESGSVQMQYILARMYGDGVGTVRNYSKEYQWLTKAAKQDYVDAQYELGILYLNGRGITKDEINALAWFMVSASHGDKKANAKVESLRKDLRGEQIKEAEQRSKELLQQIQQAVPKE